jgi:hypothetical protein
MKSSIFWDTTPYCLWKISKHEAANLLSAWCWLLAWLILRAWRAVTYSSKPLVYFQRITWRYVRQANFFYLLLLFENSVSTARLYSIDTDGAMMTKGGGSSLYQDLFWHLARQCEKIINYWNQDSGNQNEIRTIYFQNMAWALKLYNYVWL